MCLYRHLGYQEAIVRPVFFCFFFSQNKQTSFTVSPIRAFALARTVVHAITRFRRGGNRMKYDGCMKGGMHPEDTRRCRVLITSRGLKRREISVCELTTRSPNALQRYGTQTSDCRHLTVLCCCCYCCVCVCVSFLFSSAFHRYRETLK